MATGPQNAPLQTRVSYLPQQARIARLPADSFIRIASPVFTGMLSAVGLVYSFRGRHGAAAGFALAGMLISSFVAVGRAVEYEERLAAASSDGGST